MRERGNGCEEITRKRKFHYQPVFGLSMLVCLSVTLCLSVSNCMCLSENVCVLSARKRKFNLLPTCCSHW